jgi:putative ABC transport system permease protein
MSQGAYRCLLRVLPRSFRDEFGEEMAAAFRDECDASRGWTTRVRLWGRTIAGLSVLAATLCLDQWRLDLRDAGRAVVRQPLYAGTLVLTLALAFGPALVALTLFDRLVVRPLPLPAPDQVHAIWRAQPERGRSEFPWSELNVLDLQAAVGDTVRLAAYTGTSLTVGGETPQQVRGALVGVEILDVLGLSAPSGRGFLAGEDTPGGPAVAMASPAFLRARFGSSGAGRELRIDGRRTLIIGTIPATGVRDLDVDLWVPLAIDRAASSRGNSYLDLIGRLAPGVPLDRARDRLRTATADLARAYPTVTGGWSVDAVPLAVQVTRSGRRTLKLLGVTVLALLVVAMANVAALSLVRANARRHELAVRAAVGAGQSRLRRQLLVEYRVLGVAAGVLAIVLAEGLLRGLVAARLVTADQGRSATFDPARLASVALLVLVTTTLLGRLIGMRWGSRAGNALNALPRQTTTRADMRLRSLFVASEVAAAFVLLVSAALLAQSSLRLWRVDPGFDAERLWQFQVTLPAPQYSEPESRVRFIDATVERLRQLPGIEDATSAGYGPMTTIRATRRFARDDRPLPEPGQEPQAIDVPAGTGYQQALGLRLVDGRWFDARDTLHAAPVVVVSEALVRQMFPGERPIGRRIRYFAGRPGLPPPPAPEIVGVVSDVRQFNVAEAPLPQIYSPHAQRTWGFVTFFVRIAGSSESLASTLARAVQGVDAERPIERLSALSTTVIDSIADRRALGALMLAAALSALVMAIVGVYGITAAVAAGRAREMAIRTALGADRRTVVGLIISSAARASAVGLVAGIAATLASSQVLTAVLYETPARDARTIAGGVAFVLALCVAATVVPVIRALRADPSRALRGTD